MEGYSIYSEFDVEKHKQTFTNYLEAVLHPSGLVEYAVPSHLEKLISITGETHEVIYDKMPIWESPVHWLTSYTGCVSLWSDFYIGEPTTEEQKSMLRTLISEGLTKDSRR